MHMTKTLSTGELMIFDKASRDLILIPATHSKVDLNWDSAKKLVNTGDARLFKKSELSTISDALKHVALLG